MNGRASDTGPRILCVTAMYPTAADPVFGVVVRREVDRLRLLGTPVDIVTKAPSWRGYFDQALATAKSSRHADVVHAHYGTSGLVAAIASGRRPLVVTLHGSDIALGPRPRLNKYWLQYLLSVLGGIRAAALVVQDDSMFDQLPKRLRGKVVVLGQSVALPTLPWPDAGNRHGVLFLSDQHRPVKRFPLACAAMDLLPGAGSLDSLDRYAVEDIDTAMSRRRVGLLTSEREGMPVAVKEALAAGMRVVAVDLPGLRRLARTVPEALTLTAHDPTAISNAVATGLAADPLTNVERLKVHGVLRDNGWTEPERTIRLQALYTGLVAPNRLKPGPTPRPSVRFGRRDPNQTSR